MFNILNYHLALKYHSVHILTGREKALFYLMFTDINLIENLYQP